MAMSLPSGVAPFVLATTIATVQAAVTTYQERAAAVEVVSQQE
jgi:hypothetical protein